MELKHSVVQELVTVIKTFKSVSVSLVNVWPVWLGVNFSVVEDSRIVASIIWSFPFKVACVVVFCNIFFIVGLFIGEMSVLISVILLRRVIAKCRG